MLSYQDDTREETTEESQTQSMYVFEGKDYSQEPSAADLKAFDQLIQGFDVCFKKFTFVYFINNAQIN